MPGTWRQEMTKQGFNYPNHTVIDLIQFVERLESLEPTDKKTADDPKMVDPLNMERISKKKRKRVQSVPDIDSTTASYGKYKMYCMLCGLNTDHDMNKCEDLIPIISKEKKKKKRKEKESRIGKKQVWTFE